MCVWGPSLYVLTYMHIYVYIFIFICIHLLQNPYKLDIFARYQKQWPILWFVWGLYGREGLFASLCAWKIILHIAEAQWLFALWIKDEWVNESGRDFAFMELTFWQGHLLLNIYITKHNFSKLYEGKIFSTKTSTFHLLKRYLLPLYL